MRRGLRKGVGENEAGIRRSAGNNGGVGAVVSGQGLVAVRISDVPEGKGSEGGGGGADDADVATGGGSVGDGRLAGHRELYLAREGE